MLKLIVLNIISLFLMGLLLFLPIMNFNWPAAWFFILECGISGFLISLWLYKYNPNLLAERSKSPLQKGQTKIDTIIMLIIVVAFICWYPLIAIDANFYHWAYVPFSLQVLGAIFVANCMWFCFLTFKENTFAFTAIKVVKNQKVISTGPYAIVRHPMYSSAIFFFIGAPLLLGSWLGVIWGFGLIILMGVRAIYEEKMLSQKLEGYSEYKKKIRYRFIPFIW